MLKVFDRTELTFFLEDLQMELIACDLPLAIIRDHS